MTRLHEDLRLKLNFATIVDNLVRVEKFSSIAGCGAVRISHLLPATSSNGMVATGHPLATQAGVKVLAAGGKAVDAVLSAAAVTWVTMPMMCGPGGDAYAIVYESGDRRLTGMGAGGKAPAAATRNFFLERGQRLMPLSGPHSVGVPGAMAVIEEAHRRFGTMSLEELWRPAIRLAEDGFPVTRNVAAWFAESASRIQGDPESSSIYLRSGVPPAEGAILVQGDLARTLRRLSVGGAAEFYGGSIGEQLISCLEPLGGLMTADDLKSPGLDVYTPLHSGYRGFDIHQTAPPSQGLIHLETMNILQGVDVAALPPQGDELIHLGVEANKLAVADRLRHVGDPLFVDYDVNLLLSEEHARRRQALIAYSAQALPTGSPAGSDTTYLCAVDRDGNAVSFIHSLSLRFGAGITVPGTGVVLNNRVGRGFTLDAGHPNCLAPGKRTMSTLNCYVVTRGGLLHAVGGTPGGDSQVQWNSQILSSLIDQQLDPARAVDKVRWTHSPSTDPATLDEPETLTIEARISQETLAGLQRRGHRVRVVGPYAAGGDVQLIVVDRERGVLVGASDPRGDGIPIGL